MATKTIPASYEHKCDACGKTEISYSDDRPKYWALMVLIRDAYDYQGSACGDATARLLMCGSCQDQFVTMVNDLAGHKI